MLPAGLSAADPVMLAHLARDLPGYLRRRLTPEQAADLVRRRLATRSERFLALAERLIYRRPSSPYRRLLRMAGCEPGDLRELVAREGLEGGLGELARRGVYVSFDEFKGRREIVRGSQRFAVRAADFDPPGRKHVRAQTGGTSGTPSDILMSLALMRDLAIRHAVALDAHGIAGATEVFWLTSPLLHILRGAKIGHRPVAWFHPQPLPWQLRATGLLLRSLGRLAGNPLPRATPLDLEQAERLARWLALRRDRGRSDCVTTYASSAVRIANAARERGLGLEGVHFIPLGEPFTPAKRAAIESAGARAIVLYGSMETTAVGYGCAAPLAADDCHVFSEAYALIAHPRPVGVSGASVDAFLVTSLLPHAAKHALNLEVGDHGRLERRPCGCALGTLGLGLHLSEVRSHEKLTGEGMTFVRTRLLSLLEEVLPGRFGGSVTDYQLVEAEDRDGIVRLLLLVHPRVGPIDEVEIARTLLDELGAGGGPDRRMTDLWERAGTVQVRREAPIATRAGKIQPFRIGGPVGAAPRARGPA